jgi:hypothetical protein
MLGLGCAWKLVDADDVRREAGTLVRAVLEHLVLWNRWAILIPTQRGDGAPVPPPTELSRVEPLQNTFLDQIHQQLAFLLVGRAVDPARFGAEYERVAAAAEYAWMPLWGSALEPMTRYFKFNLQHAVAVLLALFRDDARPESYGRFFGMLWHRVAHHRNAYFALVHVLATAPDRRAAALTAPGGFDETMPLRDEIRALLAEWLRRLDLVRAPGGELPRQRHPNEPLLQALWPKATRRAERYQPLGGGPVEIVTREALPVHDRPGSGFDFVWQRHPFSTAWGPRGKQPKIAFEAGKPDVESPALDFLLPVWIAAYLGVVP